MKERKQRKKRRKKRNGISTQYTTHHLVPQSRLTAQYCHGSNCGNGEGYSQKTVQLPEKIHEALHILFENLYKKELPAFLKEFQKIMEEQKIVTGLDIVLLRNRIKSQNLNKIKKRR